MCLKYMAFTQSDVSLQCCVWWGGGGDWAGPLFLGPCYMRLILTGGGGGVKLWDELRNE